MDQVEVPALVAIAGSPIGLCNDALGSIRLPAFYNCLFGHKSTGGCIKGWYNQIDNSNMLDQYSQGGIVCKYASELWPITRILFENNEITKYTLKFNYEELELKDITFIYIGDSFKTRFNTRLNYDVFNSIKKLLEFLESKGANIKYKTYSEIEYSSS